MSRKLTVILDDNIFVCDNAVELGVLAHICVLHEDAVSDNSILADLGTAEYDTVFNSSFDLTAIGDE